MVTYGHALRLGPDLSSHLLIRGLGLRCFCGLLPVERGSMGRCPAGSDALSLTSRDGSSISRRLIPMLPVVGYGTTCQVVHTGAPFAAHRAECSAMWVNSLRSPVGPERPQQAVYLTGLVIDLSAAWQFA